MPVPPPLDIRELKRSYAGDAPIPFTIIKHVPGEVAFACAAEMQIDGRWQQVTGDIFSQAPGQLRSHTITTDEWETKWDVSALTLAARPQRGGTYRFRLDVRGAKAEPFFSAPFVIEK
jgi:hypothetical protein